MTDSQPQIQLSSVEKRFGSFTAVHPLNLNIQPGEFVVLLGPSGCGKTTTLRMIAGLESASSGTIRVAGRDVTRLRAGERDIAFVFQMFALYPHLSAFDNIAFPLRAAGLSRHEVTQRVQQVATRLAITHLLPRKPRTLAGGDQQRVSLARAMVRQPAAFLMDEPLGTLDADQREHTRAELRAIHNDLNQNGGATTVFVTHDQLEAMSLADRIAIMNEGKLLQFAPPREIYDHPASLFVANFIGSPGMNFLPAKRTSEHDLTIQGTEVQVPFPTQSSVLNTQNFTVGLRPEYLRLDPTGTEAVAEHTQRLGSYNLLTLKLGPHTLKARVPSHITPAENEKIRIAFDPAGLRYFDSSTGQNLEATP